MDAPPCELGAWSYEVIDAKLAREARAGAVLQITLYSDLLSRVQGVDPERMHLALGGPGKETETFRYHDFAAYYRSVRERLLTRVRGASEPQTYPDPVEHCDVCSWKPVCDERRRADDHVSLVAGITRRQRRILEERNVVTLESLAKLPLAPDPKLDGVTPAAFKRVREQARIQSEGRAAGSPKYELFTDVPEGFGLARLPEPSAGDLFFDIESHPYALDEGLEYLFGWCDDTLAFERRWAFSRAEERVMFEGFMDMVGGRLQRYPDLHVYHFGHYEPTAIKRLAGRYGTREAELDRLLKGRVMVDLHRVVTQSLRASVESYSIKKLEPFFRYKRVVDLRTANSALSHFEAWLALGEGDPAGAQLLAQIEGYNRDDCVSTAKLRDWLEGLRRELAVRAGAPVPRPIPPDPNPEEEQQQRLERVALLMDRLTEGVPVEPSARTADLHARWLLAQLLEFHRREAKSFWWQYFEWLGCTEEELLEDRSALAGLAYVGKVGEDKRSHIHRYVFPRQDHTIVRGEGARDPATEKGVTVWAVDDAAGFIDLKRGATSEAPHPRALIPYEKFPDAPLRESLFRLADSVLEHGLEAAPQRAAVSLLRADPPRVRSDARESLRRENETTLDAGRRLALELDASVLPVQGPPGAGKTYTGAHMILDLLAAGKRVGVTATSHKVIGHLLDDVCEVATEVGRDVSGLQLVREQEGGTPDARIEKTTDSNEAVAAILGGRASLVGGTAWLWARPELEGTVDVLVVDEAAQMSLANALAAAPAAKSLILLGDPQQLSQPTKGVHPPGAAASALSHIVGGSLTLPAERGLFLDRTWRLHPDLCAFTSEVFYEGRLRPVEGKGLERQVVHGTHEWRGTGLRAVSVDHVGNTSESLEEVAVVKKIVNDLLRAGATWTNAKGETRTLTGEDILIVAPYNAQVGALLEALPTGARVGTVDKFQGQEAPIVIYSAASSSAEEAPRGMEFLYEPNRLNVATSRARCLALLVGSPTLYAPDCRSVRNMKLANAFCRFAELAH
jgi:uncharacterized protein